MSQKVSIYDTTLRDGEQAEGISFSLTDKMHIALELDKFGVDYIEGGWPGAYDKANEFFQQAKSLKLTHARLSAFGMTRRKNTRPEHDKTLGQLLAAQTPTVTIFGKSWDFHVTHALRTTLEENLQMIGDSIGYLKKKGKEVVYDAEHFFDGYKHNPGYALKTLAAAAEAGADVIVLCDTNGGSLPFEIFSIIQEVKEELSAPLGIHAHNDSGNAVANSLMAVHGGCMHVQGTVNGFGERCGNADLIQIIPALELKMKLRCIGKRGLRQLSELSRFINEVANLISDRRQPYVGASAFTHKAGVHVSAVLAHASTYEHIKPEAVGNRRRVITSEMAGKSNLRFKLPEWGFDPDQIDDRLLTEVSRLIKRREYEGYQYEVAEGSVYLMLKKAQRRAHPFFDLHGFRVIIEKRGPDQPCISEATIKLSVNEQLQHTASEGDGPVNALDQALRKALIKAYPQLKRMRLSDFKVRVVNPREGTAAKVRVIIESTDKRRQWATVGVSENIIEASWEALVDSIDYKLIKDLEERERKNASTSRD